MRVIVQKVKNASVIVKTKQIGVIEAGLLIYLGIEHEDDHSDADWLVKKLIKLRLFKDSQDVLNLSVKDVNGSFLVVSQFTLHASTKKGNRPSYYRAAKPNYATELYEYFVDQLWLNSELPVQTGEFGADMDVKSVNDGPVTIIMDSKSKE